MQKLLEGEDDWTCVKEVLGWTIETEAGKVALLEHKIWELLNLVNIPDTQRRMI